MNEDLLDYAQIVRDALRHVPRRVLERVATEGFPGDHHLYLAFRTDHEGVAVPGFLRDQYPEEITVVLQHQFWDLETDDDGFGVTLSFAGRPQRLEVPWAALTALHDPSVQFGMRFEPPPGGAEDGDGDDESEGKGPATVPAAEPGEPVAGGPNVISFDDFRRKS